MGADEAERVYDALTDADLLRLLETEEDRLPREAVDEFVRRAERMVEPLMAICRDETAWQKEDGAPWAAVHAAFILGAVGGARVLPGLLDALVHAQAENVDWVTEELPTIFGSIGPAAVDGLMGIVSDEGRPSMARWSAATCLGGVAARHEEERDRVLDFLHDVAGRGEDYEVRGGAGLVLLDFLRPADREVLHGLGKEIEDGAGPVPLFFVDDVESAYGRGKTHHEQYLRDWLEFYAPDEIAERQARWKREDAARASRQRQSSARDDTGLLLKTQPTSSPDTQTRSQPQETDVRPSVPKATSPARPTVGRNAPCPCGSGKKFKKCCGL